MKKRYSILICLIALTTSVQAQSIASLYKEVNQSVVTIITEQKNLNRNHQVVYSGSIGSGVMISEEGEILTAAHVVSDASQIKVKLLDGEEIPAKVIKSANVADLALIKLSWKPKEFKVAKLGDSDQVSVGDQIFVVGAPFGLEHSLSVGYISARKEQKARTSGFTLTEFFQTDASINSGNSGGPMFNLKGEVIGISSYIISRSGGFQGLGFAATSNVAANTVVNGNRRWTGIKGFILDERSAAMLNVPLKGGLLIESVVSLSPADFSGLRGGWQKVEIEGQEVILGGDIILAINDIPLTREAFEKFNTAGKESDAFFNMESYKMKVLNSGKVRDVTFRFEQKKQN